MPRNSKDYSNLAYPRWIFLCLIFFSFHASADVYTNCQALLVDGTLAQQGEILHNTLKKFALHDYEPAYFKIGRFRLAIIPVLEFGKSNDITLVSEELQNINEEWKTRWGIVTIYNDITLNNLPAWTIPLRFTEILGLFLMLPIAEGQPMHIVGSISTVLATTSYLVANAVDGPEVASALCNFFDELDVRSNDFTANALFVIQAPQSVILALRAFARFSYNDVTYYPRPWIERKEYKKMLKAKKVLEKQAATDSATAKKDFAANYD
ncbi:MAG: hypothetical protein J6Y94_08325, partial [Bacteriovoracaceae bacterium]|nr:hypothetical protein [Bacteriovoracaceae bacterium]